VDEKKSDFVVLWEFWVRPGAEAEFERAYGSEGAWVRLFSRDPAYGGTKLVRDVGEVHRYLTFDYWASAETYDSFKRKHTAEYGVIDRECEGLTESEKEIGRFEATSA
jgi:heme-degrading monooxygenase HmoA